MKKCALLSLVCVAAFTLCAELTAVTGQVCPGEWNSSFTDCKAYADAHYAQMFLVVGATDCSSCKSAKEVLETDSKFLTWKQNHSGMVYCLVNVAKKANIVAYFNGKKNAVSADVAAALDFTSGSYIPRAAFYWPQDGGETKKSSFSMVTGYMPIKEPKNDFVGQLLANLNSFFLAYFKVGGTPADRLEFCDDTTEVQVPYVGLDGKSDYLNVNVAGKTEDVAVSLELGGQVYGETTIYYVGDGGENNPKNPLWLGERDEETLEAGEWTMDRDLAVQKAKEESGSTLTLIGGSLWCPDCVNADAYLVDTGVFKNWATNNGIYCAAIDVPKFPYGGNTCLLTYESTQTSDRYVNATNPKQERVQSGAGYLSRHSIPQSGNGGTNATAILARNLSLTTNSVANGGFCRPECIDTNNVYTGVWKTGIPCFILQNSDGRIVGRLEQFSNVSPTNDASAAAYVRRLEELRQLSDDPTEELNRHWSTATTADCEFSLEADDLHSTISAIDTSDFWRIADRSEWSRVTFTLGGGAQLAGENDIRLNLWRVTKATSVAKKVASATGNLDFGVTLANQEIEPDESVDYFIQVEAIDTSARFALDRAGDSVANYVLSADVERDPGKITLDRESDTVSEADAKKAGGSISVYVPLTRVNGASGCTNVTLTIDEEYSTAMPDRYEIVSPTVSWADGELGTKSVEIKVFDDGNADGTQYLILRLDEYTYTLTIKDNDKINVGKVSFADAVPAVAKKGTVIAEEGSEISIYVARINGASGDVGCSVVASAGQFTGETSFTWNTRESGGYWTTLRLPTLDECPAGKVTISFTDLSGITADASSKTLTVQMTGADAPRFEVSQKAFAKMRYCELAEEIAILNVSEGAKVKVTKLSGTLPGGISVKAVDDKMQLTGITSRSGIYEVVYQVSETVNRKTVPGQTIRLTFEITDVAALDPSNPGANPAIAKRRTFADTMVIDSESKRMTGLITGLSVSPSGVCSAKYKCAAGTISLSSKSWCGYDPDTGTVSAHLTVSKKSYVIDLDAYRDGSVIIELEDPDFVGCSLSAEVPEAWSAANPATEWQGLYTVVMSEPSGETTTAGSPPLTLKMNTASTVKNGKMSYSGVLPNGQSFSGSATLVREDVDTALLPIYYRTTKECFTAVLPITRNAPEKAIRSNEDVLPWWSHTESKTGTSEVNYSKIIGSWYDKSEDLLNTVAEGEHALAFSDAIDEVAVTITSKGVTLDAAEAKANKVRLSLNKSTGILSGTFVMLNSAGKAVTASYKGVLLPDWGDGCVTCMGVPWAMGAFWYAEGGIKHGDVMYIENIGNE